MHSRWVGMIVALLMVVLDCRRQYCCTLRLGITSYPPPGSVCNVSSREVCLKAGQSGGKLELQLFPYHMNITTLTI